VRAVILANPESGFPEAVPGHKLYYVTDDWPAGAALMGLSRRRILHLQARNAKAADHVASVSSELATQLSTAYGIPDVLVLPNGCSPDQFSAKHSRVDLGLAEPVAGLLGQLNERLDLEALDAVVDRGISLAVVGPRTEREPSTTRRLDALLSRSNVRWLGPQPAAVLPAYLASMTVGLTPYADTAFNRASFPLKTLEYLAAGLPVVSTDLPSVRWLETELIDVVAAPGTFGEAVRTRLLNPGTEGDRAFRRTFARAHSWEARARQLLETV
jgi:Glycosyltransferase